MVTETIIKAVRAAKEYAELRGFGNRGNLPGDDVYITPIDKMVESSIRTHIDKKFRTAGYYGQTTGFKEGSSGYLFIIDSFTGHSDTLKEDYFEISVSAFCRDEPVSGVIYNSLEDRLFAAEKLGGCFLGSRRIFIPDNVVQHDAHAGIYVHNPCYGQNSSSVSEKKDIIKRSVKGLSRDIMFFEGFHQYCMMCKGDVDVSLSFGADSGHFAGFIIMQEAGAIVTDEKGIAYDLRSRNVVSARPEIYPAFLQAMSVVMPKIYK